MHQYSPPYSSGCLGFSLSQASVSTPASIITARSSHVPCQRLNRARATSVPGSRQAVTGYPPGSSRGSNWTPVTTAVATLTTLPQWFTHVRLPGPHLTHHVRLFRGAHHPGSFTGATHGGLRPPPAGRPWRARLHHQHNTATISAIFYLATSSRARGAQSSANLDRWTSPEGRLITLILIRCGLRATDACTLAFDCLIHDGQGAPYLRYLNHKMRREAAVPVDEELQAAIRGQQKSVAGRWPGRHPHLFPALKANAGGQHPVTYYSYRGLLNKWLDTCDVRDEHGGPVHLTPHQWRTPSPAG